MRTVRHGRRESRRIHFFAVLSVVLALVVRLYWVFRIQSPYDAVYSDMGGYVERARSLISGAPSSFPRLTALYPYGAHYVYAGIFRIFGYDEHKTAVCILHALLGAMPAYFFVLFAARFFVRAWAPGFLGVLFAIWQPIIWCTGFFVSEVPYLALLFGNSWLCLRFVETRRGGFALGITGAILFAVRPQFILTFAVLAAVYLWSERKHLFRAGALSSYVRVLVPWLVVIAFSVGRYHRLTGHWGLISENGTLNRLFADTTVGRVQAYWLAPNGDKWNFQVEPPCKKRMGEHDLIVLKGYIADAEVLGPVRRTRLEGKSVGYRVYRAFNNVRLLWDRNTPWPEDERARVGMRRSLQQGFNGVARWVVIPLACLGVIVLRKRAALVVVLAHLVTLVILSMFFFPEARYRVPYDPFLLCVGLAGAWQFGGVVLRRLGDLVGKVVRPS